VTATSTRLVRPGDARGLAAVRVANRERLRPYEPIRTDDFYTEPGQRAVIDERLALHADDRCVPLAIVDADDEVVGEMTLSSVIRGAFQSASVGYWVSDHVAGRGAASAALRDARQIAFGRLGLHRLQGETLTDNVASQRVLERAGFVRYGVAPDYLRIDGRWQEHVLYRCIAPGPTNLAE
jgi:ribosomal-protein-alanine N-acetyltransferase